MKTKEVIVVVLVSVGVTLMVLGAVHTARVMIHDRGFDQHNSSSNTFCPSEAERPPNSIIRS